MFLLIVIRVTHTPGKVPLDYSDPDGEQAAVALVRHPSVYPPDHEKYKGPILFNPGESLSLSSSCPQRDQLDSKFCLGGPGGSGIALVVGATPSFRKIIGDEFDFIGFDPRGIFSPIFVSKFLANRKLFPRRPLHDPPSQCFQDDS